MLANSNSSASGYPPVLRAQRRREVDCPPTLCRLGLRDLQAVPQELGLLQGDGDGIRVFEPPEGRLPSRGVGLFNGLVGASGSSRTAMSRTSGLLAGGPIGASWDKRRWAAEGVAEDEGARRLSSRGPVMGRVGHRHQFIKDERSRVCCLADAARGRCPASAMVVIPGQQQQQAATVNALTSRKPTGSRMAIVTRVIQGRARSP